MKSGQELKGHKVPIVRIDPTLEKHKDNTPFPDKLAKVNEMLNTAKLPKRKP